MTFQFKYTPADIRHGWKAVWRFQSPGVSPQLVVGPLALLIGLAGWWYSLIYRHDAALDSNTIYVSIFSTAMLIAAYVNLLWVPKVRSRVIRQTLEKRRSSWDVPVQVTLRRDGIMFFSSPTDWTHVPWEAWERLAETRKMFLLYRDKDTATFLPKHAFESPEQMQRFRAIWDQLAIRARQTKAFPVIVPGHSSLGEALVAELPPGALNYMMVDAFTSTAFGGNPAAVVWLDREMTPEQMQSLAMEFNQAETAFISPRADGRFDLRWFTPTREVPLCGHATLAAARAMQVGYRMPADGVIRFVTRESGELICTVDAAGLVTMDFPATPPVSADLPPDAARVLGIEGPVECVGTVTMNLTLRVANEDELRRCKPDMMVLATWHPVGVTVTAKSDQPDVDFVSRFFAPQSGIPEDPVTGSAHCSLAVYWARVLGKMSFVARQLSPRRGELSVTLSGDRVELRGNAVVVMRGRIEL